MILMKVASITWSLQPSGACMYLWYRGLRFINQHLMNLFPSRFQYLKRSCILFGPCRPLYFRGTKKAARKYYESSPFKKMFYPQCVRCWQWFSLFCPTEKPGKMPRSKSTSTWAWRWSSSTYSSSPVMLQQYLHSQAYVTLWPSLFITPC